MPQHRYPDPQRFPPDRISPAFLLMNLGSRVRDEVDTALRGQAMSIRLVSALGHLARQPGLSYSELARRAGISPQSMQATLTRLEETGAVARHTEAGRGRTARLEVTDTGREMLAGAQEVVAAVDRRLADQLGADRHQLLGRILLDLWLDQAETPPAT